MAFDISQEVADFRDIELDEFGEPVVYRDGIAGTSKTILAIRPTPKDDQMKPGRTEFHQIKTKMDLLVSRLDVVAVNKGKDTVTMKVEPDDVNTKTLLVSYCTDEYGAWRLGLV